MIEVKGPWGGLVTAIDDNRIERAIEWVGDYNVAIYRARKLTESGKVKGARAWACIGNYGTCINETAPPASDLEDNEPESEAPAPTITLDKWGIE